MNSATFHSTDMYPKMKVIEDNWMVFKNEIPKFDPNNLNTLSRDKDAWNNEDGKKFIDKLKDNKSWIKGWLNDVEWYQFPLMYHGEPIGKAVEICPKSINILKQVPGIRIAGFALLLPNEKLPIHTDDTGKSTNSMAANMGLISLTSHLYVRDNQGIFQTFKHQDGKMVIFDSENEHYADNQDQNNIRYILYIDFKTDD
jgi:beta-hydroxylase